MKNVLVLYNGQSMYTPTVQDYVEAFSRYSKHNVHYLHAGPATVPEFDFGDYDLLLITYSVRLCYAERVMSPAMRAAIRGFPGLTVAFVQDEYQETLRLRHALRDLDVKLVFTCVPEDKISWVYPPEEFGDVRFVQVLTGYVPDRLRHVARHQLRAVDSRPNWIGYRGRQLGHCWGDLAHYKVEIGKRFKTACVDLGVPHDIAWTEQARIYEDEWYGFLTSCRATLGTPSGCNVFDWDGSLERHFRYLIKRQPDLTYEEYRPVIAERESEIDMGQISPRVFEAAALGTVLVMLESDYGGVVTAGEHYIPVRADFSNVEDVIDQLRDVQRLTEVADAAHEHLIASGSWSYESFIVQVDVELDALGGAAMSDVERSSFLPAKAFDQSFLEEHGLKSSTEFPLSRWLDLSKQRARTPGHERLLEDVLGTLSFPGAVLLALRHGVRSVTRIPRRLRRAFDLAVVAPLGRRLPERAKRPLRGMTGIAKPPEIEPDWEPVVEYSAADRAPIQQAMKE